MFSNLTKGQQVYVIDKSGEGTLKIGVVEEVKIPTAYQYQPLGMPYTFPFDVVVKYEDGSNDVFPQLQPNTAVATYNNQNTIVCDSRDVAQMEVDKINSSCRKQLELVPYYEKLLASTEMMMRQLNPNYAKQQETDEEIKNLKTGMAQMTGTLTEMKSMMERMIAGISSSKKSNN